MKIQYVLICCSIFLWMACQPRQTQTKINSQLIVGEWRPADESCHLTGYHFHADGLCENNFGFLTYIVSKGFLAHDPCNYCMKRSEVPLYLFGSESILNNILHYHGNVSSYQIEEDTLRIYDPAKAHWFEQQIRFLSPDTMMLSYTDECDDPVSILFSRVEYTVNDEPLFDQIVFGYPGEFWYGNCFSIQRDGMFIRLDYRKPGGYFVGKMRPGEFERIETLFKKTDLNLRSFQFNSENTSSGQPRLGWVYAGTGRMHAVWPMQTRRENKEFYQAYISALYSPYTLHLEPVDPATYFRPGLFDFEGMFSRFKLKQDNLSLDLEYLELFHLNILFGRAENTNQAFEPKYQLEKSKRTIAVTDGRFFRYTNAEGREETLDIGYNFIEVNGLDTLFGKQREWEKY